MAYFDNEKEQLILTVKETGKMYAALKAELNDKLTVRDQFAMAALPVAAKAEGRLLSDDIARMAYELADAMLKAREAK